MMSNVNQVKKALRDRLVQLVGVQRCLFGQGLVAADPVRDADLRVYLWSGVVIHVHLIDEPIKSNKVRRIIENGTSSGIPTLFMLDSIFLPKSGARTEADKWFLPFQALTNDHLYAYQLQTDESLLLFPVHFRPITRLEVEAMYRPPFTIQQIRHFRQTVKQNALKGFWLLADIEGDSSGANTAYQRATYDTFQPPPNGTSREMPRVPERSTVKTRLEISFEVLGLKRNATRDEVKAAFRKLAFEVHPDVSELPKPEAEARFKLLSEAYEYIKSANKW